MFHPIRDNLSEAELENYKQLLAMAANGLALGGHPPEANSKAEAFKAVLHGLTLIQPNGVVWKGCPDFITDDLLAQLQEESAQSRTTAIRHERHFLGYGGPVADKLAVSKPLIDLARQQADTMTPTGIARYIFYDQEGCGLSPRIDTEIFTLSAILMLRHEYATSPPSHLVVYSLDEVPQRILLNSGEMLLLFAGSTVQAYESVKKGEIVNLLWIQFHPTTRFSQAAPFVPTPERVAVRMLEMAQVSEKDVVYDLGCGDGRIPVIAAKQFYARSVGLEHNLERFNEAQEYVRKEGLESQVRLVHGDLLQVDVREATVVTLFLNSVTNEQLRPILEKDLFKNTRVVCHTWPIKGWEPSMIEYLPSARLESPHKIYLYER